MLFQNLPTHDELTLMTRAGAGDRDARDWLVRRLAARVERLARALLRNGPDAKDASQTSLVEILRSAANFRGESSLDRWADRITVRTSLRWAASERKKSRRAWTDSAEGTTRERGSHKVLADECLAILPDAQRTAILLRCSFEYSVEEIAELTGVSPNTVKDRLLRGRAALRQFAHPETFTEKARLAG